MSATPFERREYVGGAAPSALAANITASSLSITGAALTDWPTGGTGPFYIVIGRATATEEKVRCTARSGNVLTVADVADRGVDGTSAGAHTSGEAIEHCLVALDLAETNQHYADTTRDHHSQYLNVARHDTPTRHVFGASGAFGVPTAPVSVGTGNATGSGDNPAREDHVHALGNGTVVAASLLAGAVTAAALGTDAVTAVKIQAGAVTAAKLGADAVTSAAIATDAVGASEIVAAAVGTAELADSAVTSAKITDGTIVAGDLASNSVTSAKITDANVTTAKFAADAAPPVPKSSVTNIVGSAGSNIAGSFADLNPSLTVAGFVKLRADTKLIIAMSVRGFAATTAGHSIFLGVRVNGVDYEIDRHFAQNSPSTVNVHVQLSGDVAVTGLAAATYTLTARMYLSNTVGRDFQIDSNCRLSMSVTETL